MISINIDKARELTKNRLRAERAPLMTALDIAFQRALESGADTSAIVAEKQRLRDVTALADACTTPEELRALTTDAPVAAVEPVAAPAAPDLSAPTA